MKKSFIHGFLIAAMLVTATGSFTSCKDTDEDALSELRNENASLKEVYDKQIEDLKKQLIPLQEMLNGMKFNQGDPTTYPVTQGELNSAKQSLQSSIDGINKVLNMTDTESPIVQKINAANQTATTAAADASAAKALLEGIEGTDLKDMKETINNLKAAVVGWEDGFTGLVNDVKSAKSTAEAAKNALAGLDENETVGDLKTRIETLERNQCTACITEEKAKEIALKAMSQVMGLDENSTLADLQTAYAKAFSDLQDEIDDLKKDVEANKKAIEAIVNNINKLVTGILVQGCNSPVLGYFALPTDSRSNMLAAYIGTAGSTPVFFPSATASDYFSGDKITPAEIALIGATPKLLANAGAYILDNDEEHENMAYAGNMYVTINPNTVDFEGATLSLENSQGTTCPVILDPLKKSDYRLSFGWTRAGSNNGFYEAPVYIPTSNLADVKARIDLQSIKSTLKDVVNRNVNLMDITTTIYKNMTDVLDANAVKASYITSTYDAATGTYNEQEHSVYSQYAVGCTYVKPLSYSFDLSSADLSFLKKRINHIGNVSIEIEPIDINLEPGTTPVMVTKKITVKQPKLDAAGNVMYDATGKPLFEDKEIDISIDIKDQINDVINNISGQMNGEVNGMIDKMNQQINGKINDYLSTANNYIDKVNNFLNRVENFVVNFGQKLQPVMMYEQTDGSMAAPSEIYYAPTKIKLAATGDNVMSVYATSYTSELIAPAAKKFVAVTNVIKTDSHGTILATAQAGDATCKAALQKANTPDLMAAIVSGKVRQFPLLTNSAYAGLTYEVSYFAVDFAGKQVRKKCYIQVVD